MSPGQTSYRRRRVLLSAVSVSAVGIAGCLGGSDENPEGDSNDDEPDLSSEQAALVDSWLDALDAEREVRGFRVFSDEILPEYSTDGSPEDDIPVLGRTYADAVADGLDHVTMPIAMNDEDRLEFMIYIYPEWADEYTSGEIDETEYFERIEETIH